MGGSSKEAKRRAREKKKGKPLRKYAFKDGKCKRRKTVRRLTRVEARAEVQLRREKDEELQKMCEGNGLKGSEDFKYLVSVLPTLELAGRLGPDELREIMKKGLGL